MKTVLFGFAVCLLASSTASAEVKVTMNGGRVSIVAKDATVRQILTEWARVGQTKIVNVERVPGGPMTLELQDVPEAQALEVLLRTLSGYITAPRAVEAANLSRFDRIIIMPTVASARPAPSAAPAPVFQQTPPQYTQPIATDDDPDDRPTPPNAPNMPVPPNRGPVFNTFPQPQVVNPQTGAPAAFPGQPPTAVGGVPQSGAQPAQPTTPFNSPVPTAPDGGVAVPGLVAPPPQQPGQPSQPVRRPDGTIEGA